MAMASCTSTTNGGSGGSSAGGNTSSGGATSSGGTTSSGGSKASGGTTSSGGATSSSGGATSAGGTTTGAGGGSSNGGATNAGGSSAAGGSTTAGGTTGTTGIDGGTAGSSGGVTVQLDKTEQTIEGFGLNTALGGTIPWDPAFSLTGADGIGLSIVRVGMNSDGSLSGDLSGAKSRNVKVIGSVWTAPANWKDNNSTSKGGHLIASHYDEWATRIATFAKNQGLYAMGAANEPDFASCQSMGPPCTVDYDTMLYTAKEMVAFINVLGPKLKAAGVKLLAPEPSEWIHLWSNTSATGSTVASHPNSSDPLKCGCFGNSPTTTGCASTCADGNGYDYGHWLAKDATAWAAIDILGTHEYDSEKAEPWPADVDGGKRSKPIFETEVSGVHYWPEEGPSNDIGNGVAVAGWIHSALVVGQASGWLWWWYKASDNTDNEGLVPSASNPPKRYYTLGNYSKFVRPGYVMVDVTGNSNTNVLLSAFTGTDGTVIVAINKSASAVSMPISIAGGTAPASCTPNVTSANDNIKAGTAVTVTGGVLTASLAASTVTTFVCK
jgi:glucuronoarabinoxylan endo-1,4-beta-xylanase